MRGHDFAMIIFPLTVTVGWLISTYQNKTPNHVTNYFVAYENGKINVIFVVRWTLFDVCFLLTV